MTKRTPPYSPEVHARAVRMVLDHEAEHASRWAKRDSPPQSSKGWRAEGDPAKRPARARGDAALMIEIRRVFEANFCVYGLRKIWRHLGREGIRASLRRPPLPASRAWPLAGFARRIVDWRVSRTAPVGFGLDALEQALHARRPVRNGGLVHHADRGTPYVSIGSTERLAEAGVEPSVGSVGDSYDNTLAETIGGLHKAEAIQRRAPSAIVRGRRVRPLRRLPHPAPQGLDQRLLRLRVALRRSPAPAVKQALRRSAPCARRGDGR